MHIYTVNMRVLVVIDQFSYSVDDLVIEKLDSSSRPYLSLLELGMFLETMNKTHGGHECSDVL